MSKRSTFQHCALASGLLSRQHIAEARAALRGPQGAAAAEKTPPGDQHGDQPGDQQVADRLVEMGLLNPWQAKQLLEGRTKFTLGPYRIVDSIGQGGMGQVFKAEHPLMGRTVAVKVLPRDKSTPEAIANFTREIQALAKLDHGRLVRALDAGHEGHVHYLVTEYVPGTDLRKLVRRDGPLGMESAAHIISQVAEGLQHAHRQGLIHRDVKPGNVLVTPEGEAKLSDLGLAGPIGGDIEHDPRHGKIVGTIDYVSPDHIVSPGNPTPAWDIYSLGCTLYYAVTGKVPFPGGTTSDKARAHCELRPLDPRRLNPRLSAEFVEVLADMMAKDPVDRIQSAAEVIERLAPWAVRAAPPAGESPRPPGLPPGAISGPPASATWVVPPPVVVPPLAAASERATPMAGLSDTVSDFSPALGHDSDSDDSMSVVVETRPPMSYMRPLLLFVAAPLALVALLLAAAWLLRHLFL